MHLTTVIGRCTATLRVSIVWNWNTEFRHDTATARQKRWASFGVRTWGLGWPVRRRRGSR